MSLPLVTSKQDIEHLVVTLYTKGMSKRALSQQLGISRNRATRILKQHNLKRDTAEGVVQSKHSSSQVTAYIPQITKLIEQYPSITGVRLWEELQLSGFKGSISLLRSHLRVLRPTPKQKPVIRFETEPGVQAQMDWSPYKLKFTQSGESIVQCFSYVLGFSRRQYIDFTLKHNFHSLLRRHCDAFAYFNGVPHQCLYDNEKTVVLRWEAGQPVFNPAFIDFITHYRCKPIACKPRHPQSKGKVEAEFLYVENNLLNARTFVNLEDLRACARWWLAEKADMHIHDTTKKAPLELFQLQEKQCLQPLPLHDYDCSETALRVCPADGFLEFETNFYSVPYAYIGTILTIKAAEHELFIYNSSIDQLACHERLPAGACLRHEDPAHHLMQSQRHGLEPVEETFLLIGDSAKEFLEGLKQKHPHHCGFHARIILQLKQQYHTADINSACKHALKYQAFDSGAIRRILKAKARVRTLESIRNERAKQRIASALPPISQRPLSEYSMLFQSQEHENEYGAQDPQSDQGALQKPEAFDHGEESR